MLRKTTVALALAASCTAAGVTPSFAATAASRAASERSPWYQTDAGAAASRANLNEKVLTPSTLAQVKHLRSKTEPATPPEAGCGNLGVAAPALVGGGVYAVTGYTVSKYDAATGKLLWRKTPDKTLRSFYTSLSVSGSGVVVVTGVGCDSISDPASAFYAYSAASGKLLWSVTGQSGSDQAVVAQGYVVAAGESAAEGSFFHVYNLNTGQLAWQNDVVDCLPEDPVPLVVGSLAMLPSCDSQGNVMLEARNLSTGQLTWQQPGSWGLQRGDFSGAHLFATDPAGAVTALDPQTGQPQYMLSQAVNVLAVDNARAYATCGSQGRSVCAYNVNTGALEWQKTTPGTQAPWQAAEAGGVLYLNSAGVALNAATGNRIRYLPIGKATALAVGDGRIAANSYSSYRILDLFGLPGY
jgi:outer membrane protein assembly factor BamB